MAERPAETAFALPVAGDVDVRYYAGLLWRNRTLIATAAAVGLALGVLVGFLQVPEFQATAMLQIDPPSPLFMGVAEALAGSYYWANMDFYNTQHKIMRSTRVGEEVARRLKLGESAGGQVVARISVRPIEESRLVLLQVTHTDPREAALWANTAAQVYIEQSLETRIEAAQRNYQWLQERLAKTQQGMRDAQEKLLKSYQTQDLFVPEGSQSAVSESISRLTNDFIEAQARRIALEAAFKQVTEREGRGEDLAAVPQVAGDATFMALGSQLGTLDLELTRLREKYKPAHPEVQKVQVQIDQIRGAQLARAQQIVEGLRAEYRQLQKREGELQAAIDAQKAQAATQSRKVSELEALRKEADSARGLYDVLLQKLNETDIAASVRSNFATLVEQAAPPASPVRPNKQRIAGIGLLLGLLLGVGLVVGRDLLDNTIKGPDEVEHFLHLDLLAAVPRYDEASLHFVTEAYQNLRTALIFGRRDERGQVVLITSTAPQEGKTTTLVNLGKLLASSGERTVVLDFDLRRAQLHRRLEVEREPGITDYFVHRRPVDELIQSSRVPNLSVLSVGPLPPNPPAILARRDVSPLLDSLRERFDWILMDSPPLASVTDGLLLARQADLMVFVVQHNQVDKKLIKRHATALQRVNPSLLGVVLNAVDVKAQGYYYYYHYDQTRSEGTSPLGHRAFGNRKA
jgi:polysaccharide biosynthesis transport protein